MQEAAELGQEVNYLALKGEACQCSPGQTATVAVGV